MKQISTDDNQQQSVYIHTQSKKKNKKKGQANK